VTVRFSGVAYPESERDLQACCAAVGGTEAAHDAWHLGVLALVTTSGLSPAT